MFHTHRSHHLNHLKCDSLPLPLSTQIQVLPDPTTGREPCLPSSPTSSTPHFHPFSPTTIQPSSSKPSQPTSTIHYPLPGVEPIRQVRFNTDRHIRPGPQKTISEQHAVEAIWPACSLHIAGARIRTIIIHMQLQTRTCKQEACQSYLLLENNLSGF